MSAASTPANHDAPAAGGGGNNEAPAAGEQSSSSPVPAPAPSEAGVVVVDGGGGTGVPVIGPAPIYDSATNTEREVPAETLKAIDEFVVPEGYRREGTREASFLYSLGVYV
ncbi:unnamed protein product, partial [Pylaiella littoralis]